jgi:4-hydroxybenzoate polyprenyltransferase
MNDEITKEILLFMRKEKENDKFLKIIMLIVVCFVSLCFAATTAYIVNQAYDYDVPMVNNTNNNTNGGSE